MSIDAEYLDGSCAERQTLGLARSNPTLRGSICGQWDAGACCTDEDVEVACAAQSILCAVLRRISAAAPKPAHELEC